MFTFPPNSLAAQKLESFNKVESIKEGTRRGCYCRAPSRSRRKGRARAWRTSKGRSTNGDLRASPEVKDERHRGRWAWPFEGRAGRAVTGPPPPWARRRALRARLPVDRPGRYV